MYKGSDALALVFVPKYLWTLSKIADDQLAAAPGLLREDPHRAFDLMEEAWDFKLGANMWSSRPTDGELSRMGRTLFRVKRFAEKHDATYRQMAESSLDEAQKRAESLEQAARYLTAARVAHHRVASGSTESWSEAFVAKENDVIRFIFRKNRPETFPAEQGLEVRRRLSDLYRPRYQNVYQLLQALEPPAAE